MTDNEKAKEVARGDEILEKYVENVKRVEKTDVIFREKHMNVSSDMQQEKKKQEQR